MSNRSGSPYSVPRDANHVPFLVAASTADGITPVVLEADPNTHLLQVSSSGGGGGTQSINTTSGTGGVVPVNAFYVAGINPAGNLRGIGVGDNGDAYSVAGDVDTTSYVYNGTTYDRMRSASSVANTTGTGLVGVGLLEWDGTNYQRVPSARFAPSTTSLNTYSIHLTTNTTTTPTASTAYISSIAISNEVGGTTSTITIQDKQGTPLKLVNGIATTALTTAPTILTFNTPVKMVSGIDIITAGAVAATVDVWVNYYQ